MKAAGSPVPAPKSKSSSVSLSDNRHPILQESLPTSITDKQVKDTAFLQFSFAQGAISNNGADKTADSVTLFKLTADQLLFNPRLWMHLESKRLTTKYRASKMFSLPFLA